MRISDWSSDVCSSDLLAGAVVEADLGAHAGEAPGLVEHADREAAARGLFAEIVVEEEMAAGRGVSACSRKIERAVEIGRASGRERVCQDGQISGVAV